MVAANPKAARDITVWIVKAVEKASILFAQLQMDLSLFWRQAQQASIALSNVFPIRMLKDNGDIDRTSGIVTSRVTLMPFSSAICKY